MRERSPHPDSDSPLSPDLPAEVFRAAEVMLHILEAQAAAAPDLGAQPRSSRGLATSIQEVDEAISEEHTIGASLIIQFWLANTLARERRSDLHVVIREVRSYLSALAGMR